MKIGILTFTHTSNYGASLQAYALQRVLTGQGTQCEIIDYDAEALRSDHDPKAVWKRKGIARKLVAPILYGVYWSRLRAFERFEKKHCRISSKKYRKDSIAQAAEHYDKIVAGSDQVWNTEITDSDDAFFLSFAKDAFQRCSYAASFGTEYLPEEQQARWECYLRDFSVLSVREKTGQQNLQQRLGRQVSQDIDPTLLLPPEEWQPFIKVKPRKRDYIFVYMIPEEEPILQAIRRLAEEEQCDIVWVRKGIKGRKGFHILNTISPDEFLNHIYHAKIVVAGSFHALCFSLVFQKSFYYTQASVAHRSVRLLDLLDSLGLTGRALLRREGREEAPIDYAVVNAVLARMREESMRTIRDICGGETGSPG